MKPVAIVSTGMVLPGCSRLEDFWQIVSQSECLSTEAEHRPWSDADKALLGSYGELDRIPHTHAYRVSPQWNLDAESLDISPDALKQLDRGIQFALSACRDAFMKADVSRVSRDRVGVILGSIQLPTETSYRATWAPSDYDPALSLSGLYSPSSSAQWVASSLGLGGRAYTLDAACASSLFALKHAIDELNTGAADMMLSGGVCCPDLLFTQMGFTQLQALSRTGKVRPFDQQADGLLVGEGAVVFALKRLDDALASGDEIWGVIRGVGLSNDPKGGVMVPQSDGQLKAMRMAYRQAGWTLADMDYIECHATGTAVGDRVELNSLKELFSETGLKKKAESAACDQIVLGAGKANFGHLLTAAGALGLLRCVAAMRYSQLPPTVGFSSPKQEGDDGRAPFRILRQPEPWPKTSLRTRKAAVSAFGFGGTNGHLLLDEVSTDELRSFEPLNEKVSSATADVSLDDNDPIVVVATGGFHAAPPDSVSAASEPWKLSRFLQIQMPVSRFRIPPRDLTAMLPQQQLTLLLCDQLAQKIELGKSTLAGAGVYVGLELDPSAHAFGKGWEAIVSNVSAPDGLPQLTAERVLGSLASLTASRVAKYFNSSAPSLTFSQQAQSGIHAAIQAITDLQNNLAQVGFVIAVDTPTHGASVSAYQRHQKARGHQPAQTIEDGALGMVLMRRSQAISLGLKEGYELRRGVQDELRSYLSRQYRADETVYRGAVQALHAWAFDHLPHEKLGGSLKSGLTAQHGPVISVNTMHTSPFFSKTMSSVRDEQDFKPSLKGSDDDFMDYKACQEFAEGKIAACFGDDFADVDDFPSRVRLPSDKLLLCHRVKAIGGEPKSLGAGTLVTEHDVCSDSWYLDNGRIPTAIAIEAGQADLLLSAWLGADYETKGLAYYRLLDAMVTFHSELPKAGDTIRYEIKILNFFKQGSSLFFRFSFDAFVGERLLMKMSNGCAGFFTPAQLAAGKGIAKPSYTKRARDAGSYTGGFEPFFRFSNESYSDQQVDALRAGDLSSCLGEDFKNLAMREPLTIPGGDLRLVHRVLKVDSHGGWYGKGFILAEADIDPDSWFLTSHFKDDPVMPGTLMYECCLHTLRIFMMRMGFVDERGHTYAGPLLGHKSQLNCRGQVLPSTCSVQYELHIRELGFGPDAYAIVDAVMCADRRPIVDIQDMTLSMPGLTNQRYHSYWSHQQTVVNEGRAKKPPVFTQQQLQEFASGMPSRALGAAYKVFDEKRFIARLPRGPLQLISWVEDTTIESGVLVAQTEATSVYEIPQNAWYFGVYDQDEPSGNMPYAILLEIGLQCCGWMSAYMGAALTSDQDLYFRNLQGKGRLLRDVSQKDTILRTQARRQQVSRLGSMIILGFSLVVTNQDNEEVFSGESSFGFFDQKALEEQKGLPASQCSVELRHGVDDYRRRILSESNGHDMPGAGHSANMHDPLKKAVAAWNRIDQERTVFEPNQGMYGKGRLLSHQFVRVGDWFFQAHFLNDPVMPGSLGLEGLIQSAVNFWNQLSGEQQSGGIELASDSLTEHDWIYRGQVLERQQIVIYDIHVRTCDLVGRKICFDGYVWADDLPIYRLRNFSLHLQS